MRTKKQGNLKLTGTPRQLRERGQEFMNRAKDALGKADACYRQAVLIEQRQAEAEDQFLRQQHYETCEECQRDAASPSSREVGFHIAHMADGGVRRA